jgi:hypothetical protein
MLRDGEREMRRYETSCEMKSEEDGRWERSGHAAFFSSQQLGPGALMFGMRQRHE